MKRREREEEIGRRRVGHNFLACPPARRSHNLPPDFVRGGVLVWPRIELLGQGGRVQG